MKNNILFALFISFLLFFIVSCASGESEGVTDANDDSLSDENDNSALNDFDVVSDEMSEDDFEISDDNTAAEDDNQQNEEDSISEEESFSIPAELGNPEALIVTSSEFKKSFSKLALLHTLTGIYTEVVTIDEICSKYECVNDTKNDTAFAIKSFVSSQTGLKYLILGGDIEVVPSRRVHDKYSNVVAGTYEEDFYTDYYFADFSDWDSNKNGIYAEDSDLGIDYRPEIAVSRIPVSISEEAGIDKDIEAQIYFEKVLKYMTDYNYSHIEKAALLANIATKFQGIAINAGFYFEAEGRTLSLIPGTFVKKKLYAESTPAPTNDAAPLTVEGQKNLFLEGTNLIIHNGHGYPSALTLEQGDASRNSWFYGEDAYKLKNSTYPIFLSGACQAAQFEAPFIWHTIWEGKEYNIEFKSDAAGEMLVNAPLGGAIAYLGNSTTGLGLAGGSQFIDKMIEYFFKNESPIIGDALKYAHQTLPENDKFKAPIINLEIPVIDPDSYKWTQKSVTMLGDLLIPFYNKPFFKPEDINVKIEKLSDGVRIEIPFASELNAMVAADSIYYQPEITKKDSLLFKIKGSPKEIYLGYQLKGFQSYFKKIDI